MNESKKRSHTSSVDNRRRLATEPQRPITIARFMQVVLGLSDWSEKEKAWIAINPDFQENEKAWHEIMKEYENKAPQLIEFLRRGHKEVMDEQGNPYPLR